MGLTAVQSKIESRFQSTSDFLPYIDEIRFPVYKTLEENLTIPLDWPIVALTGPNGTNKSSILQAISAAPAGRSLAQFWFSTEVDDIDHGVRGSASHRFIYKFRFDQSGTSAECRKYRGKKQYRSTEVPKALQGKRDPDYWEPTKRVATDSMAEMPKVGFDTWLSNNRDRWNQIKKNVVYLDFRSELSAFDKYIHHQSFSRWASDPTQKRYRAVLKSKWIARALSGETLPKTKAPFVIEEAHDLDQDDVNEIAQILGKPIASIAMLEHRFFGPTGFTIQIRLEKTGSTYSEAHAGSGEYAVVRLVNAIRNAPERSLILLDEPEVSLHPEAQTKLLEFIEREVLRHGHQVVMSTHSPTLAAGLPPQAIKVLGFDPTEQQVVLVANGCSPTEAFFHLGHSLTVPTRPMLLVEDELAAELVRTSLRCLAPAKLDSLDITPATGGADGIVRHMLPTFAITKTPKASILLDGDQRPETASATKSEITEIANSGDLKRMQSCWAANIHKTLPNLHSNSDKTSDLETMKSCLSWANNHLGFLPNQTPEEAIARAFEPNSDAGSGNWKSYWEEKAQAEYRLTPRETLTSAQVLELQLAALRSLPKECELFKVVCETLDQIIDW